MYTIKKSSLMQWFIDNSGLVYGGLSVLLIYSINLNFIELASTEDVISLFKFLVIASWINVISNLGKSSIMLIRQKNKQNLLIINTITKQILVSIILFFIVFILSNVEYDINIYAIFFYLVILRIQDTISQMAILRISTNTYFVLYHLVKSILWFLIFLSLKNYFSPILSFMYSFMIASGIVSLNLFYISSKSHSEAKKEVKDQGNRAHLAYWSNDVISVTIITVANLSINYVDDIMIIATFYIAMRLTSVFEQINTYFGNKSMNYQANNYTQILNHLKKTTFTAIIFNILALFFLASIMILSGYHVTIMSETDINLFILFVLLYLLSSPIKFISSVILIYFTTKNLYKTLFTIMIFSLITLSFFLLAFYYTNHWIIIFLILLTVPVMRIAFFIKYYDQ